MADIILEVTSGELNYSAGVTSPIQEQLNSIKNALANVETSFVASRNYTKGEYFIYDTSLFLVSENIASGTAFVNGSNVNVVSNGFLNSLSDILTFNYDSKIPYSSLSAGWRAPKSGMCIFTIEPNDNNNAYMYIEDNTDGLHDICKVMSVNGQPNSCSVPIIKNHDYQIRRSTTNVRYDARAYGLYYSFF